MAELHVQKKRSGYTWLWVVLILLLVLGGVYYYLHYYNSKAFPITTKPSSSIQTTVDSVMV